MFTRLKEAHDRNDCAAELPRYSCHKEVWALKIAEIHLADDSAQGAMVVPADPGYGPFHVDAAYLRKQPCVGGYYVVYQDGYSSYSPAAAFEKGYDRV